MYCYNEDPYEAAGHAIVQPMEKSVFWGVKVIFIEAGFSKWKLEQYLRQIVEHEGEVVSKLTEETTHLVTKNYTDVCEQCEIMWVWWMWLTFGLSVVPPAWLDKSLKKGILVNVDPYGMFETGPTSYTP